MNRLSDTSSDVQRRMVEAYRLMSPDRKWQNLGEDWVTARLLHTAGFRHRNPAATAADIRADWLRQTIGTPGPMPVPNTEMTPLPFSPVLRSVLGIFDRLGIGYALGGSIASSIHGIGRMSRDADVSVEPFAGRETEFVAAFDPDAYYLSQDAVREAVRDRFLFSILHPESGFKIDVYVLKDEPYPRSAFQRRIFLTLADEPDQPVACYAAEDVILFKLQWFRLGGEVSEQQWNDVLGVLRTQTDRLDTAYLDQWAATLGLSDLLARAHWEV
ncbi:MAG TPA: hypothetical protein VKE40_15265 [Gemmataceae bacterium]|nr:hypothetical protein [Gemmataceae bacterium]